MNEIELNYFCQMFEFGVDARNRLISKLNSIQESQQALIRIRTLTLRNHFLGQDSDDIDAEIAGALLHFENQVDNSFFGLHKRDLNRNTELIIFVAGTPRTGNSITRLMITAMGFTGYAVHSLDDLNFGLLESRSVIQCHTDMEAINKIKKQTNIKVIKIVRHPLDVLESMRKYVPQNIEAKYWGITRPTYEIEKLGDPKRFYRWAVGRDAKRLMNLSIDAANNSETKVFRYEDLVNNPKQFFDSISEFVGDSLLTNVEDTLDELTKLLPAAHITRKDVGAGMDVSFTHKILIKLVYRKLFRSLKY